MKANIIPKFMYNTTCYSTVGNKFDYIMNSARISAGGLKTENVNACVAGILGNGKYNLEFHLAPEQQSLKTLERIAIEKIEELLSKTKETPLDGFIFGGWGSNVTDKETARLGTKIYNIMAEIMEDFGANISLICGSKKPNSLGHIIAKDDRVNLVLDDFKKLGLNAEKIKNMSQEEVGKYLENYYETVELHPDHLFTIG